MPVYQTGVFTNFTTRQLNGERGGNRTRIVTVLQTAPYASIGNSPFEMEALRLVNRSPPTRYSVAVSLP